MLQPKRTKYRKVQKGRMKGVSQRGHELSNGMFGIKSLDSSFITSRQIEAARIAATRFMKREGQLWIYYSNSHGNEKMAKRVVYHSLCKHRGVRVWRTLRLHKTKPV